MADAQIRKIFKNDSVMGRYLDGEDDNYDESPRSSVFSNTDSGETLVNRSTSRSYGNKNMNETMTTTGGSYNTGPKGVRSDAMAYTESQSLQRRREMVDRRVHDTNRAFSAQTWTEDSAETDARDRWVEKRLKELSKSRTGSTSTGLVEQVDASGYLHTIESNRSVCVLILDDVEQESNEVLQVLISLAPKYPGIKIIALPHFEAEIDEVACPAILVYQDGQLTVNAMRVLDELPSGEEVGRKSVEDMLFKIGVLNNTYKLDRD